MQDVTSQIGFAFGLVQQPTTVALWFGLEAAHLLALWHTLGSECTSCAPLSFVDGATILVGTILELHRLVCWTAESTGFVEEKVFRTQSSLDGAMATRSDEEFNGFTLQVQVDLIAIEGTVQPQSLGQLSQPVLYPVYDYLDLGCLDYISRRRHQSYS